MGIGFVVIGLAAGLVPCLGAGLTACSSHKTPRPPEIADCVPPPGEVCPNPPLVGGSMPGVSDAMAGASEAGVDGGSCGSVDPLLSAMFPNCVPCIVANGCCTADQACSGPCESLLQCTLGPPGCGQGDPVCLGNCVQSNLMGLRPYQALAQCLAQNCGPQCPMLQQ